MGKELIEVWEELHIKILNFLKGKLRTEEDAEDMLQEIYIKIHKNIGKLEDKNKIVPWIYTIARNSIKECYRSCHRFDKVEIEESHIILLEEEEFNLNDEVADNMKKFIDKLPRDYKEVLNLYEIEGLTHKEIAVRLNINENTSKTKLRRAKEKLKKELAECCTFKLDNFGNILNYKKNI